MEVFKTVDVEHLGSIDCGQVLPFYPKSELDTVSIPDEVNASEVFTLRVRGISLSRLGIHDGDLLLCRRKFSIHNVSERSICAVLIHSTGELVAKRVIRGANKLILKASGGDIPDRELSPDDVEIKGIVFAVQRPIENFFEF